MHRCVMTRRLLARALLAAAPALLAFSALATLSAPAAAWQARNFPATALRGVLVVTAPPEATLNGQATRLAPGARIHGADNLLQMSGAIVGQKLVVNFTLDAMGQPLEVWVLRDDEAKMSPWPRTLEQAQSWRFDAAAQTWTKP
ncbi:MAG TPA: hypothetical protein VLA61_08585 [Ideonella sp.]|uniref:hypothetical protein n=1 Tax=Ideonella sp. TaxID=1929293 RepID=UPI002BBC34AF|nr:hypothetical protein [Ideonella sp.]HSI48310.1 hypothetical protein [Ideonella sp.]